MTPIPAAQPIDCRTAVRRLWDFLDEELDEVRYAEMEAHLRDCAECSEHVAFARAFLNAVSTSGRSTATPPEWRASVVARLAQEGFRPS